LNLFTIEPAEQGRRDWPAVAAVLVAAFLAVIVFLPPEGRIAAPVHNAIQRLLGQAAFVMPLAVAFVGVVLAVRRARPATRIPRRRLLGVAAILVAVLPIEHLLARGGEGTGLVGEWVSTTLMDLLGAPGAMLVLLVVLGAGISFAFDLRLRRVAKAPHAES
jgi:4TM region of DNA translocase FtsK/SpoIIIE